MVSIYEFLNELEMSRETSLTHIPEYFNSIQFKEMYRPEYFNQIPFKVCVTEDGTRNFYWTHFKGKLNLDSESFLKFDVFNIGASNITNTIYKDIDNIYKYNNGFSTIIIGKNPIILDHDYNSNAPNTLSLLFKCDSSLYSYSIALGQYLIPSSATITNLSTTNITSIGKKWNDWLYLGGGDNSNNFVYDTSSIIADLDNDSYFIGSSTSWLQNTSELSELIDTTSANNKWYINTNKLSTQLTTSRNLTYTSTLTKNRKYQIFFDLDVIEGSISIYGNTYTESGKYNTIIDYTDSGNFVITAAVFSGSITNICILECKSYTTTLDETYNILNNIKKIYNYITYTNSFVILYYNLNDELNVYFSKYNMNFSIPIIKDFKNSNYDTSEEYKNTNIYYQKGDYILHNNNFYQVRETTEFKSRRNLFVKLYNTTDIKYRQIEDNDKKSDIIFDNLIGTNIANSNISPILKELTPTDKYPFYADYNKVDVIDDNLSSLTNSIMELLKYKSVAGNIMNRVYNEFDINSISEDFIRLLVKEYNSTTEQTEIKQIVISLNSTNTIKVLNNDSGYFRIGRIISSNNDSSKNMSSIIMSNSYNDLYNHILVKNEDDNYFYIPAYTGTNLAYYMSEADRFPYITNNLKKIIFTNYLVNISISERVINNVEFITYEDRLYFNSITYDSYNDPQNPTILNQTRSEIKLPTNITYDNEIKNTKVYRFKFVENGVERPKYFIRNQYYFQEIPLDKKNSEITLENNDPKLYNKKNLTYSRGQEFIYVPAIVVVFIRYKNEPENNEIKAVPGLVKIRYSAWIKQDYSFWDGLIGSGWKSIKDVYMEGVTDGQDANVFIYSIYNPNCNVKKLRPQATNTQLDVFEQEDILECFEAVQRLADAPETFSFNHYVVKNKKKKVSAKRPQFQILDIDGVNTLTKFKSGTDPLTLQVIKWFNNTISVVDIKYQQDDLLDVSVVQDYTINLYNDTKTINNFLNQFRINIVENKLIFSNTDLDGKIESYVYDYFIDDSIPVENTAYYTAPTHFIESRFELPNNQILIPIGTVSGAYINSNHLILDLNSNKIMMCTLGEIIPIKVERQLFVVKNLTTLEIELIEANKIDLTKYEIIRVFNKQLMINY